MEKKGGLKYFFFLSILLILAEFFVFEKSASAKEKNLVISEIMYYYSGHSDWIELYNPTDKKITIEKDDFGIIDEKDLELGSDGIHYKNCHKIGGDLEIDSRDFLIIADDKDDFESDYPTIKSGVLDSAFSLSSDGDYLKLSDDRCATFFLEMSFEKSWGGANNGQTLEKKKLDDDYGKSDWQESYENGGTPGRLNSEKPESKNYAGKVKINEIAPSPLSGEKEFIEIVNLSDDDIDFSKWSVKDEKENKKTLSGGTKKNSFYYKSDSFSLNSEGDSIFLFDENNTLVDSVKYTSSQKDKAYAYDPTSASWRWTSQKTPGEKNKFDKILSGKIKKDDSVYVGIYAEFEAKADSDAQKFTWNFGDGHKSYLKKTRHKYEKAGTYKGSLKIQGNGETNEHFFTVKVEKYKAPKVRIASISPNPKGSDTKNEFIVLENKSKKKIDLEGWSIATGQDKLSNHPIREEFVVKPGKTKKLTRKICAFTLNNAKNKIELRDPSGKVVQKIKYDRTKNKIEEDEIYQKSETGWDWLNTENNNIDENAADSGVGAENNPVSEEAKNLKESTITLSDIEIQEGLGKFSADPAWNVKKENKIILLGYNTNIKTPAYLESPGHGQVAGASTEKNIPLPQKHWAVKLINFSLEKINSGVNQILNKLI